MKRKHLFLLISAMLFYNGIVAQEKLSLSLDAARQHALQFNKTLKNSGLSVADSQEKVWEAISAGLPQMDATVNYSNSMGAKIKIQFQEGADATEIPIKPASNFNLQLGQLIFSGNYIVGVQTAKLYKKLSEKSFSKTGQDIIAQVTDGYYLVLISEESLEIVKNNMENLRAIYKKTEPMVKVGITEKIELDQLSVQLNSLGNSVNSAERQLEMAKNMLRLQLGVSADTEIELTESLQELIGREEPNSLLSKEFTVEQNYDYQLVGIQEEMAKKQVNMQIANYLPTVSGYYSFTAKILKPAFDMSPPHVVGLQMNIPVFSSGERLSKVRQAQISLESMQNSKSLLADQLAIQDKQLRFNLKSAVESYNTQKENVKVSREVYKNLKQKYEQGMISSLELTSADNNYLKAESDFLSAIFQVLEAQNELIKLSGELK